MSEKSAKLDLNVGKVGASFAFAALSAAWLPARVWAEDTLPGLWGNTETVVAEPYVGTPGLHTGQVVLSLLLVVGVLAALAWMLRRLQAQRPPVAPEEAQEQVLFCSRFNARQTLIVTEQGGKVRCMILNANRVELMTELPGVSPQGVPRRTSTDKPEGKPAKTFREVWAELLRGGKR